MCSLPPTDPRSWADEPVPFVCSWCKGAGKQVIVTRAGEEEVIDCPRCKGEGLVPAVPSEGCRCSKCCREREQRRRAV